MSEIIKWDSNRFVMREYLDTGAVYIYDKVENVGYVNQTGISLNTEQSQGRISNILKKHPKELQHRLGKDYTIFPVLISNPNGGKAFSCVNHEEFYAILFYYVQHASLKQKSQIAEDLLFKIGNAGSLSFILHSVGVQLKPVFEEESIVETIDVHNRIAMRLESTKQRKAYCEVMNQAFMNSRMHWEMVEGLTQQGFFAKWTNFTYNLLLGTNAQGLRKVSFCDGKLIIGRNHLAGNALLDCVKTVEKYVAENYDAQTYNNLKKLHIEGSQIAVLTHRLLESDSYIKNTSRVRELEPWKNPEILEWGDDSHQNLLEEGSDNA
jgi:hypothetical protein